MKHYAILIYLFALHKFLYEPNGDVIELTQGNFQNLVLNSNDIWLVEFYAPWCGHCKSLAPEYKKAAQALKGVVKFGAVDMTQHQSVGQPYNITGFPTINFFGTDKRNPLTYNEQRTAQQIVDYLLKQIKQIAQQRLNPQQKQQQNTNSSNTNNSNQQVIELDQAQFNSQVKNGNSYWLIMFYAPWCGHCQSLKPHYEAAAKESPKEIKVGKVDCTQHQSLCGEFQVQGYPTLKYFQHGVPEDYSLGRTKEDLVQFLNTKALDLKPPKKLLHLTNQKQFNEICKSQEELCLIAFLPHISETGKDGRQAMIQELQKISDGQRGKPINFFWSQGGDQFDLENSLSLGFGFPALIVLHFGKMKSATMRLPYNKENINKFIGELLIGRAQTSNIPSVLPQIKNVKEFIVEEL